MTAIALSNYVDRNKILEEAFRHPVCKITKNRKPTLEDAIKATVATIEYNFLEVVSAMMQKELEDVLEYQELMDGSHEDSESKDEWEESVDQQVEAKFEPYIATLSADWLGNNTIACGLHEPDGPSKLGMSFARELYRQLTWTKTGEEKSANKMLAAAGIVSADVEAMLDQHLNSTEEEKQAMANEENEDLQAVADKMANHLGNDFDIIEVSGDIDLASDDDEILASGALPRLGLGAEDVNALQVARMMHGDDLADVLIGLITGDAKPKKAAKKPAAKKAPAAKKDKAAPVYHEGDEASEDAGAEAEGGGVTAEVLNTLSEFGGVKDADMATEIGVSRATYNNMRAGKSAINISPDKSVLIRDKVVERANALLKALAILDGSDEAHEVF